LKIRYGAIVENCH